MSTLACSVMPILSNGHLWFSSWNGRSKRVSPIVESKIMISGNLSQLDVKHSYQKHFNPRVACFAHTLSQVSMSARLLQLDLLYKPQVCLCFVAHCMNMPPTTWTSRRIFEILSNQIRRFSCMGLVKHSCSLQHLMQWCGLDRKPDSWSRKYWSPSTSYRGHL